MNDKNNVTEMFEYEEVEQRQADKDRRRMHREMTKNYREKERRGRNKEQISKKSRIKYEDDYEEEDDNYKY